MSGGTDIVLSIGATGIPATLPEVWRERVAAATRVIPLHGRLVIATDCREHFLTLNDGVRCLHRAVFLQVAGIHPLETNTTDSKQAIEAMCVANTSSYLVRGRSAGRTQESNSGARLPVHGVMAWSHRKATAFQSSCQPEPRLKAY